jgi:hypothetical protein
MLEFLNNIFLVVGSQVFQQSDLRTTETYIGLVLFSYRQHVDL